MRSHISEEEFLLEFFGNFGRDLGDPKQFYTDDPQVMMEFMQICAEEKKPAFMSIQPRNKHNSTRVFGVLGIEKLFFDFDYGHESDKLTEGQIEIRRLELEAEVVRFASSIIDDWKFRPLIIKSRRGYHIYVFFDRIYQVDRRKNFWNEVYKNLLRQFKSYYETKYKLPMIYFDEGSCDITRLGRIPFSIHQKTGEKCIIVNRHLKPDKIRSIQFYKVYGLGKGDLKRAVNITHIQLEKQEREREKRKQKQDIEWEKTHGFIGKVRPCFQVRVDSGAMSHPQRRALCNELFFAGHRTIESMVEFFRCFRDWDEAKCRYQVTYWFDESVENGECNSTPYRCDTIAEKGWCIKDRCELYRRRIGKNAK